MPDNKKNPQQDQPRKGMDQEQGQERQEQGQEQRQKQGQKQRGDQGQDQDRQDQGVSPDLDQEREQERDQVRDRDINPGKQTFGKQGVSADEDFDRQDDDEDRITQRNPQQGMATPKPERK